MNEREFQRNTVKDLRKMGFTVWVTSTNRKSRNSVGCPDLIVSLLNGFCLAIELKGDETKATNEQAQLQKNNEIMIFRPGDDVLLRVIYARKFLMSITGSADNQPGEKHEPKRKIEGSGKNGVEANRDKGPIAGTGKVGPRPKGCSRRIGPAVRPNGGK